MIILQNIINSKYHYQPSWLLVIMVFSIMILGYLYSAFNSRFNTFIKSVFVSRFASQSSREERSLTHPVSFFLSLNFILISSLFILQLISSKVFFDSGIEFSFFSFLILMTLVFLVYFIKIIVLKVFAYFTAKQEIISEYIFILFLVNHFLGVALLPIVVLIAYGPTSFINGIVYVGAIFFLGAFVFRIGRGISAVLVNRESTLFYLILYLCTLEILPLIIGIKLFERLS